MLTWCTRIGRRLNARYASIQMRACSEPNLYAITPGPGAHLDLFAVHYVTTHAARPKFCRRAAAVLQWLATSPTFITRPDALASHGCVRSQVTQERAGPRMRASERCHPVYYTLTDDDRHAPKLAKYLDNQLGSGSLSDTLEYVG